jgi:CD109 antigen
MLNFVPDIVILDYLQALETLTPEIKSKALRYLESGYQRELTYMHSDGSFSAFGKSDASGSTWLTAFVIKSFAAAAKHITIDDNIINHGVDFLIRQQQKDGEFIEVGRVFNSDIQGGSSGSGLALTSYVVLSLIEVSKIYPEVKASEAIKKGLDYIAAKYPAAVKNPYALNLASYTFHLASHEKKDDIYNLVEQKAKFKEDLKFWERVDREDEIYKDNSTVVDANFTIKRIPIYYQKMKPVSVEMTSYALMTYLIREKITESVPLGRWLLQQRNPEGGFLSTQDTVLGLTALARFALVTTSPNSDLKIKATYDGKTQDIAVNKDNALVFQEFFIPGTAHAVEFEAQGKGTALAQLSWSYYVEGPALSTFDLKVEVLKHGNPGTMPLRICNRFVSPVPSNMAVMEVHLPSGYYFDPETASEVLKEKNVRRHELDEADTKLNIYFDSFSNATTCFSVNANRVFQVANPAKASILVYDYYDNTRRGVAFYEPPMLSICDICANEKMCKVQNCV